MECIRTFFKRRFQYESVLYPRFRKTISEGSSNSGEEFQLDVVVAASGFGRKEMKVLEQVSMVVFSILGLFAYVYQYMEAVQDAEGNDDSDQEDYEDEDEDEDEDVSEVGEDAETEERNSSGVMNNTSQHTEGRSTDGQSEGLVEGVERTAEAVKLNSLRVPELRGGGPDQEVHPSNPDQVDRLHSSALPQSRSSSPTSLAQQTATLSLNGIKDKVSFDLTKERTRQQRKYHSKRGARQAGRPKGSKAKQDTRVKVDSSGVWE